MHRHFASPPTVVPSSPDETTLNVSMESNWNKPSSHFHSFPKLSTSSDIRNVARARKSVSRGQKTFLHELSWHETEVATSALTTIFDLPLSLRLRTGRSKNSQRSAEQQMTRRARKATPKIHRDRDEHDKRMKTNQTMPNDSFSIHDDEICSNASAHSSPDHRSQRRWSSSECSNNSEELGSKLPPIRIRLKLGSRASMEETEPITETNVSGPIADVVEEEGTGESSIKDTSISIKHVFMVTKQPPVQQVEQTANADGTTATKDKRPLDIGEVIIGGDIEQNDQTLISSPVEYSACSLETNEQQLLLDYDQPQKKDEDDKKLLENCATQVNYERGIEKEEREEIVTTVIPMTSGINNTPLIESKSIIDNCNNQQQEILLSSTPPSTSAKVESWKERSFDIIRSDQHNLIISRTPSPKKGTLLDRKIEQLMAQAQKRPNSLPGAHLAHDRLTNDDGRKIQQNFLRPRAGSDVESMIKQKAIESTIESDEGEPLPTLVAEPRQNRLASSSTLSGMPDTSPVSSDDGMDETERRESTSARTDEMKLDDGCWPTSTESSTANLTPYLDSSLNLAPGTLATTSHPPPMLMCMPPVQAMAEQPTARAISTKVGHVEVSVVGSPELFGSGHGIQSGLGKQQQLGHTKPPIITIDSDDERVIERCELNQQPSTTANIGAIGQITCAMKSPEDLNMYQKRIASSTSLCLPTATTMPALSANSPRLNIDPSDLSPGLKSPVTPSEDGERTIEGTQKRRGSLSINTPLPPPKKRFFAPPEFSDPRASVDHEEIRHVEAAKAKSVAVLEKVVGSNEAARIIRPNSQESTVEQLVTMTRPRAVSAIVTRSSDPNHNNVGLLSVNTTTVPSMMNPSLRHTTDNLPRAQALEATGVRQVGGPVITCSPQQQSPWFTMTQAAELPRRMPIPVNHNRQVPVMPIQTHRGFSQFTSPTSADIVHGRVPQGAAREPDVNALRSIPDIGFTQYNNGSKVADVVHNRASQNATRESDLTALRSIQELNSLPHDDEFHHALNKWEWVIMDGLRMPAVFRAGEKYVAVHMVQMRLLSKFPPNIPGDLMRKFTMVSHKMTLLECWIFNTVNALMCKFEFGCQLFSTQDEVVKLIDVERFYWSVKSLNLNRMIEGYRNEIRNTGQLHPSLTATISQLKSQVELDYMEVQKILSIAVNGPNQIITTKTPPLATMQRQAPQSRSVSHIGHPHTAFAVAQPTGATVSMHGYGQQVKNTGLMSHMTSNGTGNYPTSMAYDPSRHQVRPMYPVSAHRTVIHGQSAAAPTVSAMSYLSPGLSAVAHTAYTQAFVPSASVSGVPAGHDIRQYGMNGIQSARSIAPAPTAVPHHGYR